MPKIEGGEQYRDEAKRLVALWLCGVWAKRPLWMNHMPDLQEADELITLIEGALNGVAVRKRT